MSSTARRRHHPGTTKTTTAVRFSLSHSEKRTPSDLYIMYPSATTSISVPLMKTSIANATGTPLSPPTTTPLKFSPWSFFEPDCSPLRALVRHAISAVRRPKLTTKPRDSDVRSYLFIFAFGSSPPGDSDGSIGIFF
ncbi:hypothetical protein GWI33_017260 [Rhynchophorus ferrugineus]|uniref:Uncharacterized protein n=1 Tax=Rhynchophorus ferrugineus TaxID=354439 RepID=A0A834I9M5_RHYFE|nr:hypothetical protein GWI33_017260 [Rhynchophorus ferrugineus]